MQEDHKDVFFAMEMNKGDSGAWPCESMSHPSVLLREITILSQDESTFNNFVYQYPVWIDISGKILNNDFSFDSCISCAD